MLVVFSVGHQLDGKQQGFQIIFGIYSSEIESNEPEK